MAKCVACNKCKYYNKSSHEWDVSCEFIDGDDGQVTQWPKFPSNRLISEGGHIRMCNHEDCFSYEKKVDPARGKRYNKKRIKGQGQLNKDNDCSNFESAWWRFWIVDKSPKEEDVFLDKI
jgi:hypothetical protein